MDFSLNRFHRLNALRQTDFGTNKAHSLMGLVLCTQEELGELASAVLGMSGEKLRKAHLTKDDALDAVGDAITYLSLVAAQLGCTDIEKLLQDTFNMVSERCGSKHRV